MSSTPIDIDVMPPSPNIGYYDNSKTMAKNNEDPNSYTKLKNNLEASCKSSWDSTSGIYNFTSAQTKTYVEGLYGLPRSNFNFENISALDLPYYLANTGNLMKDSPTVDGITPKKLSDAVATAASDPVKITNQIQYLICQLQKERNMVYDSKTFTLNNIINTSLKDIFDKMASLKPFLIILFIITMYILINGFFSSMDVSVNIFSIIEKNSSLDIYYWCGLLLGLAAPIVVLCIFYYNIVCNNLASLEKYNIIDNPYGVKESLGSNIRKFDLVTLILFIFLLYAFVGILFTIKKNVFGIYIYTALISIILLIIAIFIYVLYIYVPFFNTTEDNQMMNNNPPPLKLFVDNQETKTNISTNQTGTGNVRKVFLLTFIFVFILAILFFFIAKNMTTNSLFNNIIKGFLSSSAILILPALWVVNIIFAFSFFYIYPMIFMFMRFLRYALMAGVYLLSEKNSSFKDKFSPDLIEKMDNFKNYSPTMGLIGIDELKLILNIMGYENEFSKIITPEGDIKNISQNKFISTGLLAFAFQKESNKSGIYYSIIVWVLTIVVSLVILFMAGCL
jgi:hypothetical protein